jgi:AcrR family transcriptional regulator
VTREPPPDADEPAPKAPTFIERARREQIVKAAIETIAEVGYAKASFARIAQRAGISPALISYHFRSKDQLLTQVMAHVEASMDRAIVDATSGAASYASALRGLIETQIRYFGAHTNEIVALGEIFSQARTEPGVRDAAASSRRVTLDELEVMFREGQDEGEFRAFAPRPMAVVLLAALEAIPAELLSTPDPDVEALAGEVATIFDEATRRTRPRRPGR